MHLSLIITKQKQRVKKMKEKYENLDGIRTFSAIGILCMHVLILGQFPENTAGGGVQYIG